jgi:para-aminobenzoate synthetase component 1
MELLPAFLLYKYAIYKSMNKSQAISLMNKKGKEKIPFLFLIDFEFEKIRIWNLDNIPSDVLFDFNGISNYNSYLSNAGDIELNIIPTSKIVYTKAFDRVKNEILFGNSFLINLTTRNKIETDASLEEIFLMSKAQYKLYQKDAFTFFSPESFIKIKDHEISCYPMKGTIDATIPDAENLILNNVKEKAEHNTIVDLIRNDLSKVAKNVTLKKFRYLDKIIKNNGCLLQVSSEIAGLLPSDFHTRLGTILFSLLPAGSISGAPKVKTVEIIQEVEGIKRGYYTGVAGIFDGSNLDSCVMIRYIEKENDNIYYRSGGGITYMSDADEEYAEVLQKIYVPTY